MHLESTTPVFSLTHEIESVVHETVHEAVKEVADHPTLNIGVSVPEDGLSIKAEQETETTTAERTGTV